MIYPVPDGVNWNMRTISTLVKLQKFCGLFFSFFSNQTAG